MIYRLLADGIVFLHLSFVAFVMLGGLLALRRPKAAWLHLPAALWGAWIEFSGGICPLTPLENWLRGRGAQEGYTGGFVEHYLLAALYPEGLTREVQWALGALVLAVNGWVYWRVWRRARRQAQ
jgi:Protein of Unknown function (DUF2784).